MKFLRALLTGDWCQVFGHDRSISLKTNRECCVRCKRVLGSTR